MTHGRVRSARNAPSFLLDEEAPNEGGSIDAGQGLTAGRVALPPAPGSGKLGAFLHTEAGHCAP